jgi:hypothetical protein
LFQRELLLPPIAAPWLEDESKREAFLLEPLDNFQRAVCRAAIHQYDLGAYRDAPDAPFDVPLFIFAYDERGYWEHKAYLYFILDSFTK